MKIRDAMHSVTKVPSDMTVVEAARLMDKKVIGSVLVEESHKVIGMMTERDILRKVVAAKGKNCDDAVKSIMSFPLITIDADSLLEEASAIMTEYKVRRLIVTERDEIIGIVTARDIAERLRYAIASRLTTGDYSRPGYRA